MLLLISPLLWLCMIVGAGGCNPNQDPTGPEPSRVLTPTEIAGIRLTYMCGNTFRVRNPNDQEAAVTWDVYQKNETGSLTLPPKPAGGLHSETFFTTVNKGTVRLFYNGQLIQTKANGNKPPCQTGGQQPADWPQLTELPILDTTKLLTLPNDTAKIFRTELSLSFDPEVSDSAKQAILNRFGLTVIGVTWAKTFFVRFPDRGPSMEAFTGLEDSLNAWPGVHFAHPINATPMEEIADSRYPSDGADQARGDWFTTTNATWAGRAIRSPLAWGCENGSYGGDLVPVGVLEWKHDRDHPEFAASSPRLWEPNDNQLAKLRIQPKPADTVAARVLHATQVVGMLTAEGDNGSGVAGVMWKTDLHLYAMYSSGNRPTDLVTGFYQVANQISQDGIRVLSVSADGALPKGLSQKQKELYIDDVAVVLRQLFTTSPQLTIVVAAGNDRFRGTYAAYVQSPQPAVLRSALLKLREDAQYRDRILVVTGTQQNHVFWDSWYLKSTAGANYFAGSTDIAAPAQDIVTLDRRTGSAIPVTAPVIAGTSLSAPMVAGVAAQLLAMAPTLTPGEVKDFIVRGAQEKRVDPTTGTSVAPPPVSGGPGTVHQLDAYGALSLLSKERRGTPICAVPASLTEDNSALVLQRSTTLLETIPFASGVYDVAVAQGGRRMALVIGGDQASPTHEFRLQNGTWTDHGPVPGSMLRRYLERDTVDFGYPPAFMSSDSQWVRIRRHDGSSFTFYPYRVLEPSVIDHYPLGGITVSPTGEYAIVGGSYTFSHSCPFMSGQRWHLLKLPSLSATLLTDDVQDQCTSSASVAIRDDNGTAAWRSDGRGFTLGMLQFQWGSPSGYAVYRTRLLQGALSGGSFTTTTDLLVNNRHVQPYGYLSDNAMIGAREEVALNLSTSEFECHQTARPSQNLTTLTIDASISCAVQPPALANSVLLAKTTPGSQSHPRVPSLMTGRRDRADARALMRSYQSRRSLVN